MAAEVNKAVYILYKNWRGVTAWRHIMPHSIKFEQTAHHPEPQWLVHATDLVKRVPRSFAMKDIARWEPDDGHSKPIGFT